MKRSLCLKPDRPQRGIALLGVVGMLLVFLVFAGAIMVQLANEMNSVKTSGVSNRALAAADAGVRAMVEQIETAAANNLPPPGTPVTYIYPEPVGTPATTSYSATIDHTWQANGLNYYLITSTGTVNNNIESSMSRSVRAIAVTQPISDFASFSNYEVNQFGQPVWYLPSQFFNGPVYSGGPMRIAYAGTPTSTAPPIFGNTVTTGNNPIWSPTAPGDTNEWDSVVNGGSGNFVVSKTALSLPGPSSDVYVASESWEGDGSNTFTSGFPPIPSSTAAPIPLGVYIDGAGSKGADAANSTQPTDSTGIFVNVVNPNTGAIGTAAVTSVVSGNTDTMVISGPWAGGPYTVTINYADFSGSGDCSGTTKVSHGTSSHTFSGTPCGAPGPGVTNPGNGAVFVDGNLQLGNGGIPNTTLEGDFTFTTPDYGYPNNNNKITIQGNVMYDSASSAYDKTALWGNNIVLNSATTLGLEIDASIIAGYPGEKWDSGDFRNAFCSATGCSILNQGELLIKGGLIENARGAVGEMIGSTQYGFHRVIDFDSRFATSPPPFNPMTGTLNIIAWEDLGT